jgi:predicted  nucleic acid-binding Zn-ribbon protein
LHKESGALKRYLDVLEERQIESMLFVDEKEEIWQTAQSNLDRIRASRIERHATLSGERTKLSGEVERLLAERKAAISTISVDDLGLYESLRQKRSGIAVAKVSEKSCTACGSSLSSSLHQIARSPVQITPCDTCGRILYAG